MNRKKRTAPMAKAADPKDAGPTTQDLTPKDVIGARRERVLTRRSGVRLIVRMLVMAFAGWVVFTQVFGIYMVEGEGMYPRLRDGDLVLVFRLGKAYAQGEVVAYQWKGRRYFGRVVALGGDSVDFTPDGFVSVNGKIQQEEILFLTSAEDKPVHFPIVLHQFELFVLGDNRLQTTDGRDFGTLDRDLVEGTVMAVVRRRGI